MREMAIRVPDLSCQHCVAAVRQALSAVPGVASLEVDLSRKLVTVQAPSETEADVLFQAIREAGYTPEPADPDGEQGRGDR